MSNKYRSSTHFLPLALTALLCPGLASCQSPTPKPDCRQSESTAKQADDAEERAHVHPPSKVDTSKPLALDAWRAIHREGKAAIKVADLDQRIATLRAFVHKHPTHEQLGATLENLIDGLIERGNFDSVELAELVKRLAETDDKSSRPLELVRKYHVKHALPLESGLELLAMARTRLAKDRAELENEADEWYREYQGRTINYHQTATYTTEGHLLLVHNQPDRALASLTQARTFSEKLPKDIVVYTDGEPRETLAAGAMDALYVLQAAAHHKRGDPQAAKESLKKVVGLLTELDMRTMYNDLREELAVAPTDSHAVRAEAAMAHDFSLKDLNGNTVTLSSLKGKVVLLAFWASWCDPCIEELPELQKFARAHQDKGVELLAINLNRFSERTMLGPFLESRNLDLNVLLRDDEQLSSYSTETIPALYVIDREGRIAQTRTGYVKDLHDKLEAEVLPLVEGKADSDRDLFVIEHAPANWGVLWQQPVSGGINAITIAPPLGSTPGEVGAVGRDGLMRWTAAGEGSDPKPVSGWDVHSADLDGDGRREWIVGGLRVYDSSGELYWEYDGNFVDGIRDVNGDGFQEIVTSSFDRVTVMKSVPEPLWKSRKFTRMKSVVLDPSGEIVVQADDALWSIDQATGEARRRQAVPKGRILSGRARTPDGDTLDYFRGRWDPTPVLTHDLDGDGQEDILLTTSAGVVVYNRNGDVLLRIRSGDVALKTGLGDLNGEPGVELAIAVPHYGVVVLGKK